MVKMVKIGLNGKDGERGEPGPSNSLSIGTVEDGDEANATITGDSPNQRLNLVLPRGMQGPQGEPGISSYVNYDAVNQILIIDTIQDGNEVDY